MQCVSLGTGGLVLSSQSWSTSSHWATRPERLQAGYYY